MRHRKEFAVFLFFSVLNFFVRLYLFIKQRIEMLISFSFFKSEIFPWFVKQENGLFTF